MRACKDSALDAPQGFAGSRSRPRSRSHRLRSDRCGSKAGLTEPFKGITTTGRSDGSVRHPLDRRVDRARPEGGRRVPRRAHASAARTKRTFGVDDDEWRKWMNQHFYVRQGVSFLEMTAAQRRRRFAPAPRRAERARAEADARHHAAQRDARRAERQRLRAIRRVALSPHGDGKPSATEPWGWQLDGHHAIVNYFVLGDQVVMTPFFAGSEPVIATVRQVQGTLGPAGRAEPRPRVRQRARPRRSAPRAILAADEDRATTT